MENHLRYSAHLSDVLTKLCLLFALRLLACPIPLPPLLLQLAFNHSGKGGQVNFMNGIMGIANAQRTLDYIRIITEFISQPEYLNLVPTFGIVNEPLISTIGRTELTSL